MEAAQQQQQQQQEQEQEQEQPHDACWCTVGALARLEGKVGRAKSDPDDDGEVVLIWADGTESDWTKVTRLEQPTAAEQRDYEAEAAPAAQRPRVCPQLLAQGIDPQLVLQDPATLQQVADHFGADPEALLQVLREELQADALEADGREAADPEPEAAEEGAEEGVPGPLAGLRLSRRDGAAVESSELQGKVTALFFSAQWCPACRSFTPTLKQFCEAVEETQGAALVSTAAVSVTMCRV